MPLDIRHRRISGTPVGDDPDLLQGSDWDDSHRLQQGPAALLGRADTVAGQADTTEVPIDPATLEFVDGQLRAIPVGVTPPMRVTGGGDISLTNYSHFCRATKCQRDRYLGGYYRGEQHGTNATEAVCKFQPGFVGADLLINGDYATGIDPDTGSGVVNMPNGRRIQIVGQPNIDLTYMTFTVKGTVNGVAASTFDMRGPPAGARSISPGNAVLTLVTNVTCNDNTIGDVAVNLHATPANIEARTTDDGGDTFSDPVIFCDGLTDQRTHGYQVGVGCSRAGRAFLIHWQLDITTEADETRGYVNYANADGASWSEYYPVKFVGLQVGANAPGHVDPRIVMYSPWREMSDGWFQSVGGYVLNTYTLRFSGEPEPDPDDPDGSLCFIIHCTMFASIDHAMPNGSSSRIESMVPATGVVVLPPGYGDLTLQFPPGMAANISGTGASNCYTTTVGSTFNPATSRTSVTLIGIPPGGVIDPVSSLLSSGNWRIDSLDIPNKRVKLHAAMGDARAFFPVNWSTRITATPTIVANKVVGTSDGYSWVTASTYDGTNTYVTLDKIASGGTIGPTSALRRLYGPSQVLGIDLPSNSITVPGDQRSWLHPGRYVPINSGVAVLANADGWNLIASGAGAVTYDSPSNTTKLAFANKLTGNTITPLTHISSGYWGEFGFDMLTDKVGACVARSQAQLARFGPILTTEDGGATFQFRGEPNVPAGAYCSMTLDFVQSGTTISTVIGTFRRGGMNAFQMIAQDSNDLLLTTQTFGPVWTWLQTPLINGAPNGGYPAPVIYGNTALIAWAQESSNSQAALRAARVQLGPVLSSAKQDFIGNVSATGALTVGSGEPANPFGLQVLQQITPSVGVFPMYARLTKNVAQAYATFAELDGFRVYDGSFGAYSTFNINRGLMVGSSLTHGTNNYGIYLNVTANDGTAPGPTLSSDYEDPEPFEDVPLPAALSTIAIAGGVVTLTTTADHGIINNQAVTYVPAALAASALQAGAAYIITALTTTTSPGLSDYTDFTKIGAASNGIGTVFVATGPAAGGTGTVIPAARGSGIVVQAPTTTTLTFPAGNLPDGTPTPNMAATANAGTLTLSTRWGIYANGSAPWAVNAKVRIGSTAAPGNTLDIAGSLGRGAPVVKNANFAPATTENWIAVAAGFVSPCVVTLTAATGRELTIVNYGTQPVVSASANIVPTTGGAAQTQILPGTAGARTTLVCDGAGFWRCF